MAKTPKRPAPKTAGKPVSAGKGSKAHGLKIYPRGKK